MRTIFILLNRKFIHDDVSTILHFKLEMLIVLSLRRDNKSCEGTFWLAQMVLQLTSGFPATSLLGSTAESTSSNFRLNYRTT